MKRLIQIEGDKIVRQISLKKESYTLGRGSENDIVFDTAKVSRMHAILNREGEAYHIADRNSTNHVFVNGQKVGRHKLRSGDEIKLSRHVTLLYLSEDDADEKMTELINRMWHAIHRKDFLRLRTVTDRIISLDSLEHILNIVLEEVIRLVKAERGFIALTDETGEILPDTSVAHKIPLQQPGERESFFSHSTVRRAIEKRESVFLIIPDNRKEDRSKSMIALKLQSVMCAPLLFGHKLVGILYVDSGYRLTDFSDMDQLFFTILSSHAAIAIENAKLYSQVQMSIQQLKAEIRISEERYRHTLESVPVPVAVYDLGGRVTYLNPAFTRIFGWTPEEVMGRRPEFVPEEHLAEKKMILEQIGRGRSVSGIETRRLNRSGKMLDVSISGAGFFDHQGDLNGLVLTYQDISKRKQSEAEIRFLAYHDALTQLPNRKSFYERLKNELNRARYRSKDKRRSGSKKWALLFLDLDRFKYINDTLGHDVGDELLKAVAHRLRTSLRKNDLIFRLGGDEFTVIVSGLHKSADAANVARKIQDGISRPYHIRGNELYVTLSIGISICPDNGTDADLLIRNADIAMYAAKENGGGYRFFSEEMDQKARERMELETSLRHAALNDQFIIYYQPIVDTRSRLVGAEALLRWNHPVLGLIAPDQFMALAEETGIIISISQWVLHTACQQTRTWHDRGHSDLYLAVNASARQFREPDFAETVEATLGATGFPPDRLQIEVTEGGIIDNPEEVIRIMQALRTKGIRFSIDDFGTGYSSLSYMKRFPIDTLKIDRSFVADVMTNPDDREIVRAIISMARSLRLGTVAEGVETKAQKRFLAEQGCRMMQGYYFGKPMAAEVFEQTLL